MADKLDNGSQDAGNDSVTLNHAHSAVNSPSKNINGANDHSNYSSSKHIVADTGSNFSPSSGKKITQKQLMSHYFGFGTLELDRVISPARSNAMTQIDGSGKFQQRLLMKQRQIEQQMIENRVRKLYNEEQRLQKQIEIANKHSELADEVSKRWESDIEHKKQMAAAEQQRIATQKQINENRKQTTQFNIAVGKQSIMQQHAQGREELKDYLKRTYQGFYNEKLLDQSLKQNNANQIYNQKHRSIANQRMNRDTDYQTTSYLHSQLANQNAIEREEREREILKLERIEQEMVGSLQKTLARKNEAIQSLKSKSKSLQKTIEPRRAYKYAPRDGRNDASDAQLKMRTMHDFNPSFHNTHGSPSQNSLKGNSLSGTQNKFQKRHNSIAPGGSGSPQESMTPSPMN